MPLLLGFWCLLAPSEFYGNWVLWNDLEQWIIKTFQVPLISRLYQPYFFLCDIPPHYHQSQTSDISYVSMRFYYWRKFNSQRAMANLKLNGHVLEPSLHKSKGVPFDKSKNDSSQCFLPPPFWWGERKNSLPPHLLGISPHWDSQSYVKYYRM